MSDWVISVGGGYGAFLFNGTEEEAEDMRRHKARWERASARKRSADPGEASSGKVSQCINHPGYRNRAVFIDCQCDDENCVITAQEQQEPQP